MEQQDVVRCARTGDREAFFRLAERHGVLLRYLTAL